MMLPTREPTHQFSFGKANNFIVFVDGNSSYRFHSIQCCPIFSLCVKRKKLNFNQPKMLFEGSFWLPFFFANHNENHPGTNVQEEKTNFSVAINCVLCCARFQCFGIAVHSVFTFGFHRFIVRSIQRNRLYSVS